MLPTIRRPHGVVPASSVRPDAARWTANERVRAASHWVADTCVTRSRETPEAARVLRSPLDARQPSQSVFEAATEPADASNVLCSK